MMQNIQRKILIAEDDQALLSSLQFTLRSKGYKVTVAANGQLALLKLLNSKDIFDLVITDIRMPVCDGFQLLDEINRHRITIPVIAISAYDERGLIVRLMQKGCRDFLDKPFSSEELVESVNRILEQSNFYNNYSMEA